MDSYWIIDQAYHRDTMDFLPFGEQLSSTSTTNHKFTGLERDAESNLDHTLFRKLSFSHGRWLSPDPLAGEIGNPQSLNGYSYVLNDPLNYVDPEGLEAAQVCEVNGVRVSCAIARKFIGLGWAAVCPGNDCWGWTLTSEGFVTTVLFQIYERQYPHNTSWGPGTTCSDGVCRTTVNLEGVWVYAGTFAVTTTHYVSGIEWANFFAGAGDVLSSGTSILARIGFGCLTNEGCGDNVDYSSGAYVVGAVTGTAIQIAIAGNVQGIKPKNYTFGTGGKGVTINFKNGQFARFDYHRLHFGNGTIEKVPHINTNLFGISRKDYIPWTTIQGLLKK